MGLINKLDCIENTQMVSPSNSNISESIHLRLQIIVKWFP